MKTRLLCLVGLLYFGWAAGQAPTVSTYSPASGATNVVTTTNLVLTFGANVQKGSAGNITISQGVTVLQTIPVTNAAVTVSGAQVTINPPANLPTGRAVSVQIAAGAFQNAAGTDNYAGIADTTTWRFTTDGTRPTVSQFTPAQNATNVAVAANLVMRFSEKIERGTGNIVIRDGTTVVETIPVGDARVTIASDSIVTVNPTNNLPGSAAITVSIPDGAFRDFSGNPDAAVTWAFRTADITPPTIVAGSLDPAQNAIDVDRTTNLAFRFSERIEKGTGNIVIRNNNTDVETIPVGDARVSIASDSIITINPANDLPNAGNISVVIAANTFRDLAGNNYAGNAAAPWRFRTRDTEPPVLTNVTPLRNAANVVASTNLRLVFNERMQRGTAGDIVISSGSTVVATIPVATAPAGVIVISDSIVTIDPPADLPPGGITVNLQA
ncbi:MAG: Ig-like domain-containing protein, partial [Cytophagales bacterium]|nr:Ig-like domain-containing protein [Cytophagales bacterium]